MQKLESYGQGLPDQVDRIVRLFDAHLGLITDIHDLYRDRAALEREYATRLQLLVKKATERKNKAAPSLVAGDTPTKSWSDSTLKQNTLIRAYEQIIASMSNAAEDHVNLADTFASQITEPLRVIERRNQDLKKKQTQFYQKLLSERDRIYQDRLKSKQKYDEECVEVEAYRQKQSQQQDRHADRVARQYEQHRNEMLTSKNMYLVSIAIANGVKDKFYTDDLPSLEDNFQELQTRLVKNFARVLLRAQTIQVSHQDSLKSRLAAASSAVDAIQSDRDQNLFVDLNIRPFTLPSNCTFEPCTGHYDTDVICLEPSPKVFLQNKLARSRRKLQELEPVLETKRDEVAKYARLIDSYSSDETLGSVDDAVNAYLDAQHQETFSMTSELVLRSEINTIEAALGGDEGGTLPHDFKSSSFSIPTACGYCKTSIWGLSKLGKTCRACGLPVHAKCELKVPAECTGIRGDYRVTESPSRASTISRKERTSESYSVVTLGRASPVYSSEASDCGETQTPPPSVHVKTPHGHPPVRVVFDFSASSPFELSVSEGATVHVLEEDDGSGWVKVTDNHGGKGLVPSSYLEPLDVKSPEPAGSSAAPRASGQFVRVLYNYESQGPDELSITEGEMIELSSGQSGGQNHTEGWWEGYSNEGRKGTFPSNYVELA